MRYDPNQLVEVFHRDKVLDLEAMKEIIGTSSRMTIFRKLKELGYCTSYSHAGKYYTLARIPHYDKDGLWSFSGIRFSRYGTLLETIISLVQQSEAGYLASEIKALLQVGVHNAMGKLYAAARVAREQIGDEYVYLSPVLAEAQLFARKRALAQGTSHVISGSRLSIEEHDDHLKTLLTVLDEKQRRLYLGFESLKLGHGGDVRMASLVGVNVKTVARGRRELLSKEIIEVGARRKGAGRPALKKRNHRCS